MFKNLCWIRRLPLAAWPPNKSLTHIPEGGAEGARAALATPSAPKSLGAE